MRLFIDLRVGHEVVRDETGDEFVSVGAALEQAKSSVRELVAEDVKYDRPLHHRGFWIRDQSGTIIGGQSYLVTISMDASSPE